jgi:hypothetical protein
MVNVRDDARHGGVRRRKHPPLVAAVGRAPLSWGTEAIDLCRQRGSNAARSRAWKCYLQEFSDEAGLEVVVGHYPPGTSKWNKIEHRMFSFISMNWKGEPLVSFETVVNMISATKTSQGLRVKAVLDRGRYETGVKISDNQMKELKLRPHQQNPEWNYTLLPRDANLKHP